MTYEDLLIAADDLGLITKEKDLQAYDGRIKNNRVAIRRSIATSRKKACVLAEELGHYFTSYGDLIIDDRSVNAAKQEHRARLWAYNVQIGLSGLVAAYDAGCRNLHETAEYLDVPENFLRACLDSYCKKYGPYTRHNDRIICFIPHLDVITEEEALALTNDW